MEGFKLRLRNIEYARDKAKEFMSNSNKIRQNCDRDMSLNLVVTFILISVVTILRVLGLNEFLFVIFSIPAVVYVVLTLKSVVAIFKFKHQMKISSSVLGINNTKDIAIKKTISWDRHMSNEGVLLKINSQVYKYVTLWHFDKYISKGIFELDCKSWEFQCSEETYDMLPYNKWVSNITVI